MASDWQKNVLCRSAGLTIWLWNFLTMCTVNGKQCCGSKYRYMEFGSGSWGRYVINFEKNGKNTKNSFGEKTIFFKKAFFKLTMIEENNGLGRKFSLVKSEWWFFYSIFNLLPLILVIYPIFICGDPQSSWTRIHNTVIKVSLFLVQVLCNGDLPPRRGVPVLAR